MSNRVDGTLNPPKEVAEKLPITVNFSNQVPSGGSLSSCTCTARKVSDGSDVSGTFLSGVVSVVSPRGTQFIQAGTAGTDVILTFLGTMSDTRIVKVQVYIPVR